MSDQYQSRAQRKQKETEKNTPKTKNKKPKKRSLWKTIFLVLFILFIIGLGAGIFIITSILKDVPPLDKAKLEVVPSTIIYNEEGKKLTEIATEKRTMITYEDIPKVLEEAVISVEDSRFFQHSGVDIQRTGVAIVGSVFGGFGSHGGGSTITQQLVKLSLLTTDQSLDRKVKEWYLALQLEKEFSKQEILTMYLNRIFYGNNSYGVAKAAETYFNKTLDKLTLSEAALLAGLPQLPSSYNPFSYPDRAEKRRNVVLDRMLDNGYITEKEMADAKAQKVVDMVVKSAPKPLEYGSFIDVVMDEVKQYTDADISAAGLQIYTTIDEDLQKHADYLLSEDSPINYRDPLLQTGFVLTDTQTGKIKAIGGGRNQEEVFRGYNYAQDLNRQPGSTIKPIMDYGPAIEYLNWSTHQQIVDEPYKYSNGTPISNYDNNHKGQMSIRYALQDSRNIPALKTLQSVGLERAGEFARSLGIDYGDAVYESSSIGGFNGVSPIEMAGAYAAFGNGGTYIKPHTVTKIIFPDGTEINTEPEPKQVMKDSTAYMITDMLRDVVTSGTGTLAQIGGMDIAGKTGTTNYTEETRAKYGI
ncbi:MAG: transglycosylase domain-containing protein, partial [Bacilli bacterium]